MCHCSSLRFLAISLISLLSHLLAGLCHLFSSYFSQLILFSIFLFQGKPVGTPDPSTYFRIIKEHNVAGMFVAPTGLRAVKREASCCNKTLFGRICSLKNMKKMSLFDNFYFSSKFHEQYDYPSLLFTVI